MAGPVPMPTGAAFGVAAAHNNIISTVLAYIDGSTVASDGNVEVHAVSDAQISTIAAGAA